MISDNNIFLEKILLNEMDIADQSTDSLSRLPVDVFLQQITHLPYESVMAVCSANTKLRSYCSSKYSNQWKALIDNAFSSREDYLYEVRRIQNNLNLTENEYNYKLYVELLITLLDPITQLMIYYRQKDWGSWSNPKFTQIQKFLALFLLNKKRDMEGYLPQENYQSFIDMLDGKSLSQKAIDWMMIEMVREGNMKGLLLMREKGANIHANNDQALREAARYGHLAIVKYLTEQGLNIHAQNDAAIRWATKSGHLDVVKYLQSLP